MQAQSAPTATQAFGLSVFGGGSGVFTDVYGGHNLSITAGADLTLRSYFGVRPSIELRGTYPVKTGTIASEKFVLAGLKFEKRYGRLNPYVDFLAGRGQITYENGGFVAGPFLYTFSSSAVYSPGLGVDLDLSRNWALKADYQYQIWPTYPLEDRSVHPSVVTGAVIYRFDFNHRYGRYHDSRKAHRSAAPIPAAAAPDTPQPAPPISAPTPQ